MEAARQIQHFTKMPCFYCLKPSSIQYGHCCAILTDFDIQVREDCDKNLD